MANRTKLTRDARERFLKALRRNGGNITKAARSIRMSRAYLYEVRQANPEFGRQWDEAVTEGIDTIEGEAFRRAVKGTLKPVYYRGMRVDTVREYSDRLLERILAAKKPEYRDGPAVTVNQQNVVMLEHERKERLKRGLEAFGATVSDN